MHHMKMACSQLHLFDLVNEKSNAVNSVITTNDGSLRK